MTAFTFRAPYGIPGDLSRNAGGGTIEPVAQNASTPVTGYGLPVKLSGNTVVGITASTDIVYGFAARPYPIQSASNQSFGVATPPVAPGAIIDVLRRGYISVLCTAGTPAKGGAVYVRYAGGTTPNPVGGIEATYINGTNAKIVGAEFFGPADPNGNTDIFFDNTGTLVAVTP